MRKVWFLATILVILSLVGASVGCSKATTTTTTTATTTTKTTTSSTTSSTTTAATTATTTSVKPTTTAPVDPVKIGLIDAVTGPYAAYGKTFSAGSLAAIQMVNDAGGIKSLGGAKIVVSMGNGDGTAPTAASEVERLITSEKVSAIIGSTASTENLAQIPLHERYQVPVVTILGDTTQYDKGYKYLFGVTVTMQTIGRLQGDFVDWLAKNYGAPTDRIAICTISPGLVTQSDVLVSRLAALGYKNIVANESFAGTVTDQSPLVLKLKAANPSLVIYNGSSADSVLFLKACYTYDYYPWLIGTPANLGASATRDALGADVAKKTLARPNVFVAGGGAFADAYTKIPTLVDFQNLVKKLNPGQAYDPSLASQGGARALVLMRAIENAASRNSVDIAAALRKVDIKSPDAYLVWADQYPQLKMSDAGLAVTGSIAGAQWADDMKVLQNIWPEEVATVKPRVQK